MSSPPLSPATPAPGRRPRPGLLLAGAVLLATPFLYASPAGFSLHEGWPWSWDAHAGTATGIADFLTWFAAGLAVLACGLGRFGAGVRAVATGLAIVAAARAHGLAGAYPSSRPAALGLGWMALLALLGGGAAVLGSRAAGDAARRRARAVVFTAAAGMAFLLAVWPQDGGSGVEHLLLRWKQTRTGLFLGAELEPETRAAMGVDLTRFLLPALLEVAAGIAALVLALRAGRAGTSSSRPLAVFVLSLLAASMLVAVLAATGLFGATLRGALRADPGGALAGSLVGQGLAIWLALAALVAAWLRDPPASTSETTTGTDLPAARPAARWPFVLAALAVAGLLLSAYHPGTGVSQREWPWEAVRGSPWEAGVLPVFLAAACLAALVVAAVRRSSLLAAAIAATAVLLACDVLLRDASREALFETYIVVAWVSAVAAAAVGAGAIRVLRGGGTPVEGAILSASGVVLAALVVFPMRGAFTAEELPMAGWRSGSLGVLFEGWFGEPPEEGAGPVLPWAVAVLGHATMAIAALGIAARRRGRVPAALILVAWAATLAVPVAFALFAPVAPAASGQPAAPGRWALAAMRLGPLLIAATTAGMILRRPSRPAPMVGRI